MAKKQRATVKVQWKCAGAAGMSSKKGKWQVRGLAAWKNVTVAASSDDLVDYVGEAFVRISQLCLSLSV
jgi:hypothetical protein